MNQLCKVCEEPAAGFHFGAFTCEGCKSFFGRAHNNPAAAATIECKTGGGRCVIDKKNRTSCKACRLKKCLAVGMSKSGSRYGRRSNWFKIHCLLQQQQQQQQQQRQQRRRRCSYNDHCCNDEIDWPPNRLTVPTSPVSLPVLVAPITPRMFFGFAPDRPIDLPRSERSAFRETTAGPDDDDGDQPIDLTVRQQSSAAADDHNNNNGDGDDDYETAGKRLLMSHEPADPTMPLDLTRSKRKFQRLFAKC